MSVRREREHRELNKTTRHLSLVGLVEHNCNRRPGGAGRGALVAGATSFAQNSKFTCGRALMGSEAYRIINLRLVRNLPINAACSGKPYAGPSRIGGERPALCPWGAVVLHAPSVRLCMGFILAAFQGSGTGSSTSNMCGNSPRQCELFLLLERMHKHEINSRLNSNGERVSEWPTDTLGRERLRRHEGLAGVERTQNRKRRKQVHVVALTASYAFLL